MYKTLMAFVFGSIVFSHLMFAQQTDGRANFDDFIKQYSSLIFPSERDALLDQFWRSVVKHGSPYVSETKHEAVFLYRGDDSVRVYGDFTSWVFQMPMKRLPDSNVWYLKLVFEPDARLDYLLVLNKMKEITDPLNPRTAVRPQGVRSELVMPDYTAPPELANQPNVAKGTTSTLTVSSKILGYDHQVIVYLPAGYEKTSADHPVAYFQDGKDYIDYGRTTTILDNLIASKGIEPLIGVFIVPPAGGKRTRMTEYSMNRLYERFVTTELVQFIDKKYRTRATPEGRLTIGSALGGVASLSLVLNHFDVVANAASQSGILPHKRDTLTTLFGATNARPRIYLSTGSYERNVGKMDLLTAHRRLSKVLEQRQFQYRYREVRDGHSWGPWRAELPNILRWFFPKSEGEN